MHTALATGGVSGEKKEPLEEHEEDGEVIKNPWILAIFDAILRLPLVFLCGVGGVLIVSGIIALQYDQLKNKPLDLPLAKDRLTAVTNALAEDFRINGNSAAPDTVVIWCDHCKLTETPAFGDVLRDLNATLEGVQGTPSCPHLTWDVYNPGMTSSDLNTFLSTDGSASVALLHRNEDLTVQQVSDCIRTVRPLFVDLDSKYRARGLRLSLGDTTSTAMVSSDQEIRHVFIHLAISIPIFSSLLYMYVGSIWKALTPLVVLVCTAVAGRASTCIIKWIYTTYNFVQGDTIPMFVVVALSLDYGVIYWGRFRSERQKSASGENFNESILATLKSSGMVIMVSVAVLEVGFAGMLFYPDLNGSGNLSTILVLMFDVLSVGIHSLIVPSALAALFPTHFEEGPSCCTGTVFTYIFGSSGREEGVGRVTDREDPIHVSAHPSLAQRFFRWYAKHATCAPWVYILPVVAYGCMVPFLCQLSTYKPFYNIIDCLLDKTLPEYEAYEVYRSRFTTMRASPTMMLMKAERVDSLLETSPAFTSSGRPGRDRWAAALQPDTVARSAAFLEPTQAQAAVLPLSGEGVPADAMFLENLTGQHNLPEFLVNLHPVSLSPEFRRLSCSLSESIINGTRNMPYQIRSGDMESVWWDSTNNRCRTTPNIFQPISRDGTEQLLTVYGTFDSLSNEAQRLTRFMWDEVEGSARTTFAVNGVKYRFVATYWSLVGVEMLKDETLQKRAPIVISFTVVVICAVVGWFFRSVGVSVKVSLSVVVPILSNYGILISMWQNGWFRWMGVEPVGGVLSFTMFTTFGFLLGLAIDYDVVLFARVYERRMMGYDNLSAVRMGLVETGPMVTLAGTLMVAAFLVMCFDHLAFIRQMAGLYFVGVALDTYVVRTCIAPTMLVLAGKFNYWPGKVPPETKSWNP